MRYEDWLRGRKGQAAYSTVNPSVQNPEVQLDPAAQMEALLDAQREQSVGGWYDRPEWQRRKIMEAQGEEGFAPVEQMEPQARTVFGDGEDAEALSSAWYRRPDAERKRMLARFGTVMDPADLERRAMGTFRT
jgi:hypothetical protein